MLKKRGKLKPIITSITIVILILIITLSLINIKKEKTYTLSQEEEKELKEIFNQVRLDAYPVCKAFLMKNISYCEDVFEKEEKEDCLNYLSMIEAEVEKNKAYCDLNLHEETKKACKLFIEGNLDCNSLNGEDKIYCMAFTKKEPSYCNEITQTEAKEDCREETSLFSAIIGKDISKCEQIKKEDIKDYCNAWLSGNKNYCMPEEGYFNIGESLISLATKRKKVEICYAINKSKERDYCLLDFSEKNAEICEDISSGETKRGCVEIRKKGNGACETLKDETAKNICKAKREAYIDKAEEE